MKVPEEKKSLKIMIGAALLMVVVLGIATGWNSSKVVRPVLGIVTSRTCDFLDADKADDYVIAFCTDGTVWSVYPTEGPEGFEKEM